MPEWEYYTTLIDASTKIKGVLDELKRLFPREPNFLEFTPRALMPELNRLGQDGWELVWFQPVYAGERGDVYIVQGGGSLAESTRTGWTHTYLCAFKRLKRSPSDLGRPE